MVCRLAIGSHYSVTSRCVDMWCIELFLKPYYMDYKEWLYKLQASRHLILPFPSASNYVITCTISKYYMFLSFYIQEFFLKIVFSFCLKEWEEKEEELMAHNVLFVLFMLIHLSLNCYFLNLNLSFLAQHEQLLLNK